MIEAIKDGAASVELTWFERLDPKALDLVSGCSACNGSAGACERFNTDPLGAIRGDVDMAGSLHDDMVFMDKVLSDHYIGVLRDSTPLFDRRSRSVAELEDESDVGPLRRLARGARAFHRIKTYWR